MWLNVMKCDMNVAVFRVSVVGSTACVMWVWWSVVWCGLGQMWCECDGVRNGCGVAKCGVEVVVYDVIVRV